MSPKPWQKMCKESIGNIKYNSIRDYATNNNSNCKQIIVKFDFLTRAVTQKLT